MDIIKHYAECAFKYFTNDDYRFGINSSIGLCNKMSDEEYIKKMYHLRMKQDLDLNNPKTFNEKLNWLKLYNRKSIYTQMVDKLSSKEYVANIVGEKYVIKVLGVWEHFDEIDFEQLPERFVLKCTHDSGGLIIVDNKSQFNKREAKKKIEKSLKHNYYFEEREWPYKNVKPRIIAEEYMQDGNKKCLPVYKVFCFGGNPKIIQSIQNDKTENETIDYFDIDWNVLDLRQNYPNSIELLPKPKTLNEMIELSAKCSEGFPFLRVDWYEVDNQLYFSEFTFYSDAGMEKFNPESWDEILGKWILIDNN